MTYTTILVDKNMPVTVNQFCISKFKSQSVLYVIVWLSWFLAHLERAQEGQEFLAVSTLRAQTQNVH